MSLAKTAAVNVGSGIVELRQLSREDETQAHGDAVALRRSKMPRGTPGEFELGMLTPGRVEVELARIRRSVIAIGGEPAGNPTVATLQDFRDRWTPLEWNQLVASFRRLHATQGSTQ